MNEQGAIMQSLAIKDVDRKATIKNTLDFITNKLPRLAYFGTIKGVNYDNVKVSSTPRKDATADYFLMIKEANEQYRSAMNAINDCRNDQRHPYKKILEVEFKGLPYRERLEAVGYEQNSYYTKRKDALLEFADKFLISQIVGNVENILDLHIYKD